MVITLALTLVTLILPPQQASCPPGQVIDVNRGQDYTLTLCGGMVVGLRGVEPPLHTAVTFPGIGGSPLGGDILGSKDISQDALSFLSGLLVGKRPSLVYDGYRIGDYSGYGGRPYAYVYLTDKTFVNAELIRRGYGYADRRGSHPKLDEFLALEATARREKRGVWAS